MEPISYGVIGLLGFKERGKTTGSDSSSVILSQGAMAPWGAFRFCRRCLAVPQNVRVLGVQT